jgi:hypothetical protein
LIKSAGFGQKITRTNLLGQTVTFAL